ncbi:unnamed protein product [Protopolystoma xenopodis]|uniref:Uncharacterized protein n=1 Tax=Protopolystoma xenopodis TaxID=117903 RepID=A0A3S5AK26_9PLAT|nr:unnamed protein product [Protopolystoma xenopodis]
MTHKSTSQPCPTRKPPTCSKALQTTVSEQTTTAGWSTTSNDAQKYPALFFVRESSGSNVGSPENTLIPLVFRCLHAYGNRCRAVNGSLSPTYHDRNVYFPGRLHTANDTVGILASLPATLLCLSRQPYLSRALELDDSHEPLTIGAASLNAVTRSQVDQSITNDLTAILHNASFAVAFSTITTSII